MNKKQTTIETAAQNELAGVTNGICIQGYEGSFHQVAAQQFFGNQTPILPCASFRDLVKLASDPSASDGAVMAIENSIAGSILPNYNLLQQSKLTVIGEVYLSISQNLMVNKGVQLADIKEVHSHPMAILQCLDFLGQYKWKLIETEDTALSAKLVQQHKSKHIAAIASKLAAELFNLTIVGADIQTQKTNITRFLVLERSNTALPVANADKASIYFQTNHSKGILAEVLQCISTSGINLSKLQSMPIPGSHFKYGFYADMEFDHPELFTSMLKQIEPITNSLKIFGIYKKGKLIKG